MSLPAAVHPVTVSGRFTRIDGTPASGTVTFTTSTLLRVAAAPDLILPGTFLAVLDATGSFSVALPATDDPVINPSGWTYRCAAQLSGTRLDPFDMAVPIASPALQLRDVTPAVAVTAVSSFILVSQVGAAGGVASLDAGGKVPGGQLSDATVAAKGLVQLAGDLAGTAAAPTVPGLAAKVAQWQPATNYAANQPTINPTGELVRALAAHLSGVVYNPANWTAPASGTYGPILTPAETITYNPDGTVATQVIGGVTTTYTYNPDGTVATESRGGITRTYSYSSGNLTAVA